MRLQSKQITPMSKHISNALFCKSILVTEIQEITNIWMIYVRSKEQNLRCQKDIAIDMAENVPVVAQWVIYIVS